MFNFFKKHQEITKIDITQPIPTFLGEYVQIGATPKDVFRVKEGLLHCIRFAAQMKIDSDRAAELGIKIGKANKFVKLNYAEYSLLRKIVSLYDKAKNPRTGRFESILSAEIGEQLKDIIEKYQ